MPKKTLFIVAVTSWFIGGGVSPIMLIKKIVPGGTGYAGFVIKLGK